MNSYCNDEIDKIEITQGETAPIIVDLVTVKDGKESPFDLTDATEILACFFKQEDSNIANLQKKFSIPPEITKVGEPKLGIISIKLDPVDTLLLKVGPDQDFEVVVISPSVGTKKARFKNALTVLPSICPQP